MLSKERYNRALTSLVHLRQNEIGNREDSFQPLLDQHYLTQKALEGLGIKGSSISLATLPRINTVVRPVGGSNEPKAATIIEILGMPRTGKTTLIINAKKKFDLKVVEEQWRYIKGMLDRQGIYDFGIHEEIKLGRSSGVFLKILEKMETNKNVKSLLLDRGGMDAMVFLRAGFLSGKVSYEVFKVDEPFFRLPLTFNPDQSGFNQALILCLVPPEISLKREGPRKRPGRIMNQEFLSALYDQYLRFYYELLTTPHCNAFACLDLDKGIKSNKALFDKTIEEILIGPAGLG